MNWNAIGAVGEILGAIAVVITLIYLAGQLRQNSLQLRLASSQTAGQNYSGNIIGVLSDPDKLELFRRGLAGLLETSEEHAGFDAVMLGFHTSFTHNLELHRSGVISDALFNEWAQDWVRILKCAGAAGWWEAMKGAVDEGTRNYVDELVGSSTSQPLNEGVGFLKTT